MFDYILTILVIVFIISLLGYVFITLREKLYLKNNMIVIDKESITQEQLDEADIKEFYLGGTRLKSGDEIRIVTKDKKRYTGTLIGVNRDTQTLMIVNYKDIIKNFKIKNIKKIKIVSRYGKFF